MEQKVEIKDNKKPVQLEKKKEYKKEDEHTVFIGDKNFMNYTSAVALQFTKEAKEVKIKARGRHTARAIDVVEVIRNQQMEGQVELKNIKIGSEEFTNKENKQVRVSMIELTLAKKG